MGYVPAFLGGGNKFFNFGGNKVFSVVHGLVAEFFKIKFGERGKSIAWTASSFARELVIFCFKSIL